MYLRSNYLAVTVAFADRSDHARSIDGPQSHGGYDQQSMQQSDSSGKNVDALGLDAPRGRRERQATSAVAARAIGGELVDTEEVFRRRKQT